MPKINFIEPSGVLRVVEAAAGETVMQAATRNGVAGIIGECGGSCICGTCHCYVDEAWRGVVGPANQTEADVLEFEAHFVQPESRLGCQIIITPEMEGLVLRVAPRRM